MTGSVISDTSCKSIMGKWRTVSHINDLPWQIIKCKFCISSCIEIATILICSTISPLAHDSQLPWTRYAMLFSFLFVCRNHPLDKWSLGCYSCQFRQWCKMTHQVTVMCQRYIMLACHLTLCFCRFVVVDNWLCWIFIDERFQTCINAALIVSAEINDWVKGHSKKRC